jgi:hypothetical protein
VKKLPVVLFTLSLFVMLFSCTWQKDNEELLPFVDLPDQRAVQAGIIDEASGLADSHANPGFLWVNEDSQRPTAIHLLEHNGQYRKKIFIKNVTNRDWEEIALADGPTGGKKYLYVAETGDNDHVYTEYLFYRFEEPLASADTVFQTDVIRFKYPDGPHDSEAFFVDASTKDIYLITKREAKSRVYRIAYPQSTSSVNTASFIAELPYNLVTGASYSSQGELIIKTYTDIYYYQRSANHTVAEMLSVFKKLGYVSESQGEAVAFAHDNNGFFTLSEKGFAASVSLNYYKRR